MENSQLDFTDRIVNTVEIAGRKVGHGQPCFIVAEAGVNHNGSLDMARKLIDVAAQAGADAVKFQTFRAEKVISAFAPKATYQLETTDASESQLEMAKRLELSFAAFRELENYCHHQGILFMSTPFDEESADFLDDVGVPVFKIPSGEITNLPFLAYIARKGKPMIVSTGMSTLEEVKTAVRVIQETGNQDMVLLHCTSSYPADPAESNLRAMEVMRSALGLPVGYSDHTPGIEVALAAVALGACVIEKHFTLDRALPGPDHRASTDPQELSLLVRAIRRVERALGDGGKRPMPSEMNTRMVARRSIVAARAISAGTRLSESDLALKRPGTGLASEHLPNVIGRVTVRPLSRDEMIDWSALSDE